MKIRRELFQIQSGAREIDGTKVEPEAQVVQHVFEGSAPVGLSGPGAARVGPGASMPLQIVAHASAAQVARSVSALCANCLHFNRTAWLKMLRDAEGPGSTPAERHGVNSIRAELIVNMPDADVHGEGDTYSVDEAMNSMGMCNVLREFYKERDGEDPGIIGVWPRAGCPGDTCTPDRPLGFYKPKDLDAERASASNYDGIMQRAAGKVR